MYSEIVQYNIVTKTAELTELRKQRDKEEENYNILSQESDARENSALQSTSQKLKLLNGTIEKAEEVLDNLSELTKVQIPPPKPESHQVRFYVPYTVTFEDGSQNNIIICEKAVETYISEDEKSFILSKEVSLAQQILGKNINDIQHITIVEVI